MLAKVAVFFLLLAVAASFAGYRCSSSGTVYGDQGTCNANCAVVCNTYFGGTVTMQSGHSYIQFVGSGSTISYYGWWDKAPKPTSPTGTLTLPAGVIASGSTPTFMHYDDDRSHSVTVVASGNGIVFTGNVGEYGPVGSGTITFSGTTPSGSATIGAMLNRANGYNPSSTIIGSDNALWFSNYDANGIKGTSGGGSISFSKSYCLQPSCSYVPPVPSVTLVSPYLPNMQKVQVASPVTFTATATGGSNLNCSFYVEPNGNLCIPEKQSCPQPSCSPSIYKYPTLSSGQTYTFTTSLNSCEYLWSMTCSDTYGQVSPYQLPGFIQVTGAACTSTCTTLNAKQCSGSSVQTCVQSGSCLVWNTTQTCGSGYTCSSGSCVASCTDYCSYYGQTQCSGTQIMTCGNYDADPCLEWSSASSCGTGKTCSGGSCVSTCTNECSAGSKGCTTSAQQWYCYYGTDGCYHKAYQYCAANYNCQASSGNCVAGCTNDCTAGTVGCSSNFQKWACTAGTDGCYHYNYYNCGSSQTCASGSCYNDPTCAVSWNPLSITAPASSTRTWGITNANTVSYSCSGPIPLSGSAALSGTSTQSFSASQTGIESCTYNAIGTAKTVPCSASVTVSSGCTSQCSQGQTQCSGTQVQSCVQSGNCWVWGTPTNCPSGQTCSGTSCITPSSNCACTSCSDCTNKLNSPSCTYVYMANDITLSCTGDPNTAYANCKCVGMPGYAVAGLMSGKTFDCKGHTITGPGQYYGSEGIVPTYNNNMNIMNCNVQNFQYGMEMFNASYERITNMSIHNCGIGIDLWAAGSQLSGISLFSNNVGMTTAYQSSSNQFSNFNVYSNSQSGLQLSGTGNSLSNLVAHDNANGGLYLTSSSGGSFSNIRSYNSVNGVLVWDSPSNSFANMNVSGNSNGVSLGGASKSNNIVNTYACGNSITGFSFASGSSGNTGTSGNNGSISDSAGNPSFSATPCAGACTNSCTSGAKQCSGNSVQTCGDYNGDGCTEWQTTQTCSGGLTCSGGVCGCTNQCSQGQTQCSGTQVQSCVQSGSCWVWGTPTNCPSGQTCSGNSCVQVCTNACTSGARQCNGTIIQSCGDYNGDGCTEWGTYQQCPVNQICSNLACVPGCLNDCPVVGGTRCYGLSLQTCIVNPSSGCNIWNSSNCGYGKTCQGTSCATCQNACAYDGQTQCNASAVLTCTTDTASGCRYWASSNCPQGQGCANGVCTSTCTNQCVNGAFMCNGQLEQLCSINYLTGCAEWSSPFTCPPRNTASSETRRFRITDSSPSVSLVDPSQQYVSSRHVINFNWSATDVESPILNCTLYIGGAKAQNYPSYARGTYVNYTSNMSEGSYGWNVTCLDGSGNVGASSRTFAISIPCDSSAPSVSLDSPLQSALVFDRTIFVRWTATDNSADVSPVCTVFLYKGGRTIYTQTVVSANGAPSQAMLPTLSPGAYSWKVSCNDGCCNRMESGTQSFTIQEGSQNKSFDLFLVNPPDDIVLGDPSETFAYRPEDTPGSTVECDLEIAGPVSKYFPGIPSYNSADNPYGPISLEYGVYSWNATCVDTANGSARSEIRHLAISPLCGGNTPPTVSLSANSTLLKFSTGRTALLAWTPHDREPESGTCFVNGLGCTLFINEVAQYSTKNASSDSAQIYELGPLTPGTYSARVGCTDFEGGLGYSNTIYVTVINDSNPSDTIAPSVIASQPASDTQTQQHTLDTVFTATDNADDLLECNVHVSRNGAPVYDSATQGCLNGIACTHTLPTLGGCGMYYWNASCVDNGDPVGWSQNSRFTITTYANGTPCTNRAPEVQLMGPLCYEAVNSNPVNFTWLASDDASAQLQCDLSVDGIPAGTYTVDNGMIFTASYSVPSAGIHTWNVSCTDGLYRASAGDNFIFNPTDSAGCGSQVRAEPLSPPEGSVLSIPSVDLSWAGHTDRAESNVSCGVLYDGSILVSGNTAQSGEQMLYSLSGVIPGNHTWSVICWDACSSGPSSLCGRCAGSSCSNVNQSANRTFEYNPNSYAGLAYDHINDMGSACAHNVFAIPVVLRNVGSASAFGITQRVKCGGWACSLFPTDAFDLQQNGSAVFELSVTTAESGASQFIELNADGGQGVNASGGFVIQSTNASNCVPGTYGNDTNGTDNIINMTVITLGRNTSVIIDGPLEADCKSAVQVNVTSAGGLPISGATLNVSWPGGNTEVLLDANGIATFLAEDEGAYAYDVPGMSVIKTIVTYVSCKDSSRGVKTLVIPLYVTEDSQLDMSVFREGKQPQKAQMKIVRPNQAVNFTNTSSSGTYGEALTVPGKYVFTISAGNVRSLSAKLELNKLATGGAGTENAAYVLLLLLIAAALGAAYYMRNSIIALFVKKKLVILEMEKPEFYAGETINFTVKLKDSDKVASNATLTLVSDEGEERVLETDRKGKASFIAEKEAVYHVYFSDFLVYGDDRITVNKRE